MKRILVLLLASMMLFAFVACDDNTPTPAPHEHEFGEWTITKEETCTEEGVKTRTCKGCSETETEAIPAKGHNPDANGKCTACGKMIVSISNGADFLKATMNEGEVIISLQDDITIDIAPWPTNDKSVFGTASTTSIVVEGNGHTITFHNTDSDWNAIYTENEDAVLTIKNATIDNSGYKADEGHWNGHNINFNCNVILDNVKANTSIAVGGKTATIKNSTIIDLSSSRYMLWIPVNGMNVTVENCKIGEKSSSSNDSRAIKIVDENINEPDRKAITLNVSGTTFSSDSKAAVLVTSTAGAIINWGEGNDISETADNVNAVWNDSDRADYMDRVVVNGCKKVQE